MVLYLQNSGVCLNTESIGLDVATSLLFIKTCCSEMTNTKIELLM